jgi:hypothetical protein
MYPRVIISKPAMTSSSTRLTIQLGRLGIQLDPLAI